jgi:hypothetical protein
MTKNNSQALAVVPVGTELATYDRAVQAIEAAHAVDEVKDLRDKAAAMAEYARQAKNFSMEKMALEIRIRAERRCGELIAAAKKEGEFKRGGDRKSKLQNVTLIPLTKTLESMGISKHESMNWQKLAAIPKKDFDSRVTTISIDRGRVTAKTILTPPKPVPVAHEAERPDGTPHMFKLLSALHKAIRRNDQLVAVRAAWQLDKHYGWKNHAGGQLWSELRRITQEDIGLADTGAALDTYVLWRMWEKQTESDSEGEPWRLFTVGAVLRLCTAPKSRVVDHACIWAGRQLEKVIAEMKGTTWPQAVPTYALESHKGSLKAKFIRGEKAALSPAVDIDDVFEVEILKRAVEIEKLLEVA